MELLDFILRFLGTSQFLGALATAMLVSGYVAMRLECRRRDRSAFSFDSYRGITTVGLCWTVLSALLTYDPTIAATPLPITPEWTYSIAHATVLYFGGIAVGVLVFLVSRIREQLGWHEWQMGMC